jgi:hypothetical protein
MYIILLPCVTALALGVSAQINEPGSRPDSVKDRPQFNSHEVPSRLETINYDWQKYRIRVAFHRQARSSSWHMTVEDSWSIYDQFVKEERVWDLSESRCSSEECLQIIDRSLSLFRAEQPDARFEAIHLEMQLTKDLWSDALAGLQRRLSLLEGEKGTSRADVPDEVGDEFIRAWNRSPMAGNIRELLGKHGIRVRSVRPSTLTFKDSLSGHKWSDIAKLPDAGILVPGKLEFAVAP